MTEIDSIQMENDQNWLENGWNKTEIDKIQVENDWIEFNLGVNWSKWPQFRWGTLWTPWMQPKKLLLFQFSRVSSTNDGHSVDLVSPRPHSFNQRRQFRCNTLRVTRYALHGQVRPIANCFWREREEDLQVEKRFRLSSSNFNSISVIFQPFLANFNRYSSDLSQFCSFFRQNSVILQPICQFSVIFGHFSYKLSQFWSLFIWIQSISGFFNQFLLISVIFQPFLIIFQQISVDFSHFQSFALHFSRISANFWHFSSKSSKFWSFYI